MHNRGAASYRHRFVESTKACTFKLKEASVFLWKYTFLIPSLEREAVAGKRNNNVRGLIYGKYLMSIIYGWIDR